MSALTDFTPPKEFRKIRSEGSPRDVGLAHGRELGDLVALSVAYYRRRFEGLGLAWDEALRLAAENGKLIRLVDPAIADELQGIADGAEQDPRAILAINMRTSLARLTAPAAPLAENHECTTAAIVSSATANGHTIMAQNWDQKSELQAFTAVIEQHVVGEPALMFVAEAGRMIQHGLNDAGVGVCGNALTAGVKTQVEYSAIGALARRRALRHVSLEGAWRALVDTPRGTSQNHLLADKTGKAVDVEVIPGKTYDVHPVNGVLVHSNHFLNPEAQADFEDRGRALHPDTLHRDCQVRDYLTPKTGKITVEDIKAALKDHYGAPMSVCRHPRHDVSGEERGHTLASTILDLNAGTLTTAPGPACVGTYTEYRFS